MSEPWRAELLGGFALVRGETRIERLRSLKMAAFLGCLCAAPGRLFSRDELIARFWPDDEIESGQNSLRVALSRLRAHLGEGVLEATRLHVRLVPGTVETDVADFEAAARSGDTVAALALYKGPYLPGVYDDATVAERERLEELASQVRERQARRASAPARPRLPGYLTNYFAREVERERLRELLVERRLVTLLGPGGIGKTRLATELAGSLASAFAVVAFVPLDECFEASQLLERVQAALLPAAADLPARERLIAFLHERPTLLVLDNLEQLIESGIGEAVEDLLRMLPTLRCLATSRRPLDLPGEQLFPLASLPLPQSLALFLDRARSVHPAFEVTESNREPLERLCQRLDGIPLALELAASRVRSRSIPEMARELERSLDVLARPMKLARHASLHAAIHWSWRLLPSHQQAFLARLSVFRGGWTEAAAAAVCERSDARDRLESLLDASLALREEAADGGARYRLLESIRTFASEQLPYDSRESARRRHRAFFAGSVGPAEAENVLAALESAREDADPASSYALFQAHGQGALMLLGVPACLKAARSVLELPAPSPRARLAVLSPGVQLALTHGEPELAESFCREALTVAGDSPDLRGRALAIQGQVAVARYADPATAIPPLREALSLAAGEDAALRADLLRRLGILLFRSKNFEEASACFERSEQLFAREGRATGARYALALRADVRGAQGDRESALEIYRACLEQARREGDQLHESKLLLNISAFQAALKRWPDALATERECLTLCREIGNIRTLAFVLWNVPESLLNLGQKYLAAKLMAFGERFWLERFESLTDDDILHRDAIFSSAAAPPEVLEAGRALSLHEAAALVMSC